MGTSRWLTAVWLSFVLIGLSGISVRPDWHRALHEAGYVQTNGAHFDLSETSLESGSHPCPDLPDSGPDTPPHLCAVGLISSGAIHFLSLPTSLVGWEAAIFELPGAGAADLPQSFLITRCSGRSPPLAGSDLHSAPSFA